MAKEKSCLVTTSLIGGVEWLLTAPSVVIKDHKGGDGKTTWSEKAKKDLIAMLSREKTEFPEAARKGVEFEKQVYKHANDEVLMGSPEFQAVCKEVKGYTFFAKDGKDIKIGKDNCYLYSKYDAIRLPDIKDIKTTEEYKYGKYLKGVQHKIYCYTSGAETFEYVIAEWDEYPKIKSVQKERYTVKDRKDLEQEVFDKISECFSCLRDLGLWELYREKYCLY